MTAEFVPGVPPSTPAPDDWCVAIAGQRIVPGLRLLAQVGPYEDIAALGWLAGRPAWTVAVPAPPPGSVALDWMTFTAATAIADPTAASLAARAWQILTWRAQHRWCGACRAELVDLDWTAGRVCPACDLHTFVASQPVALVAILRDGPDGPEVLLARHTYRDSEAWQLIGGFVDPAETLEQAARREAVEEAGVTVTDLTYFGSDAWGLDGPGALVTMFTARLADPDGEPEPDHRELSEARFFPLDALPEPRVPSHHISGRLLDTLVRRHLVDVAHPPDR